MAQYMLCTEEETFSASRLLLISAPSRRVWRSALDVSAPLSFPARSIRENFPCIFPRRRRMIWNTAWLREEWALADVWPEVLKGQRKQTYTLKLGAKCLWTIFIRLQLLLLFHLQLFPTSMSLRTSSVHFTSLSCSPTTCTCCLPSSRTRNLALRFSRSNTFKYKQSDSVFHLTFLQLYFVYQGFWTFPSYQNYGDTNFVLSLNNCLLMFTFPL